MLLESEVHSHLSFQMVAIAGLVTGQKSRASSLTGGHTFLFLTFCRPNLRFVKFSVKPAFVGVQPVARRLHTPQDGNECGPTQNRKFILDLCFANSFR